MLEREQDQDGESRELARRAAQGDRAAFDALVVMHQAALMRFARALTRDAAAAEDVFQETFLAAFRRIRTFRGESAFRTWLFTIARRAAMRRSRKRAGEPAEHESLQVLGEAAGWGSDQAHASPADQAERRELLAKALGSLEEEERTVIVLRDLEGLSGEEAAAVVGISVAALKSRLHRARLRLAAAARLGGTDGS